MRILLQGYAPNTPAGMGIVLEELAKRLSALGHEIIWVAPNGTERVWKGCKILPVPNVGEASMNDILMRALQQYEPDAFFTNLNWHGLHQLPSILNSYYTNTANQIDVILHTPTEGEELPPGFEDRIIDEHLNPVHFLPFTEPHYELASDKDWCNDYIPHGINPEYIGQPKRQGALYQQFQADPNETEIVAVNAGNERRKNLDRWLKAAGLIKEQYDGDVRFVMHSSPQPKRGDPLFGGWELPRIAEDEGLTPGQDIIWTKDYALQNVPESRLDHIYNDADIYLSLSGGEGFGMPITEALARETPAVLTEHDNHEWVAQDGAKYIEAAEETRMRTGDKLKLPDTQDAAEKTIELLEDPSLRKEMGQAGEEAVKRFRWEKSAQKLNNYLLEHVEA